MIKFEKIFKPISSFLIAVLIVNSFLFVILANPNPAQAQMVVTDPGNTAASVSQTAKQTAWEAIKQAWDKSEGVLTGAYRATTEAFNQWDKSTAILARVSYALMYVTINVMLTKMTKDIVGWLDGGAKGSPKITTDFGQLFEDSLDLAAGAVIGDILGLRNGELCNPGFLKGFVVLSLDRVQQPTFRERIRCSFSDIGESLDDFKKDFSKGGWGGWIRYSRRANNQIGNLIETQNELRERQIASVKATEEESKTGRGFSAQKVCRVTRDINFVDETGAFSGEAETFKVGDADVAGTLSLGSKMKDIMGNYNYTNLEDFKIFWNNRGGSFKCKIETPASAISELGSKILNAPFDTLNKQLQASAENLGKSAPAIFRPYLNAISASALNLLIRKEKGLVSGVFGQRKSRKYRRANTSAFQKYSKTLYSSRNLLGSANSLRDSLLRTLLNFSLFAGTLTTLTEKKGVLWKPPILVSNLQHGGLIWGAGFGGGRTDNRNIWMGQGDPGDPNDISYPEDPSRIDTRIFDQRIKDRVKSVVENKSAEGYPLLPPAGTINTSANICGAFSQELEVDGQDLNFTLSERIGYVALAGVYIDGGLDEDGDPTTQTTAAIGSIYTSTPSLLTGKNGWFGDVRVSAYNDSGRTREAGAGFEPWPDRYVRENISTGEVVTFIDMGDFQNGFIEVGVPPTYTDPETRATDPQIYASELGDISIIPNSDGSATALESQNERVYSRNANTGEPDNTSGNVYYITGSRGVYQEITRGSAFTLPPLSRVCVDDRPALYYTRTGDVGSVFATGVGPFPTGNTGGGWQCGGSTYGVKIADIFWDRISTNPTLSASVNFDGCGRGDILNISFDRNTAVGSIANSDNGTLVYGNRICTAPGAQSVRISSSLIILPDDPMVGIPANVANSKYQIKYFSPSFEGATTIIENNRTIIVYDDFRDPATNFPTTMISATTTIDNINPYKMRLVDFYREINELTNEFLTKIRVMIGYPEKSGDPVGQTKKTNLSGLADQIGSTPDDDPYYISVADVLSKYNNLSALYQALFAGVTSESALEGIDPDFEILNSTETNIKFALIGERCPTVPPSVDSNPALQTGCQALPSGEYNMAKRFIFEENPQTGFATNPFTGTNSNVIAGVLNLNEMTRQLATLPPDKNIIKLIRLRQILEQLQVSPQAITFYGETRADDVTFSPDDPLNPIHSLTATSTTGNILTSDSIQISLRNYPEIEAFLNDIQTANKPISDLIEAYGFLPTNTRESYPQISGDLEDIFPEITTQIQDKLRDVFLKRVELELAKAEKKAIKRVEDFIYFARDLNPTVQIQVPKNFQNIVSGGVDMKMGDVESLIMRIISSRAADPPLNLTPSENCIGLTGEWLDCASPEYYLRGFRINLWDNISAEGTGSLALETGNTTENSDQRMKVIAVRKALMAGIRKKIKIFNKFMGVNINSTEFENKINYYQLDVNTDTHTMGQDGHDGTKPHIHITEDYPQIDINGDGDMTDPGEYKDGWDRKIEKGLEDVYIYYTGFYNLEKLGVNNPGTRLSTGEYIYNDIKTSMNKMTKDLTLLQKEFEKIKDEFTVVGSSNVFSLKDQLNDMTKNLKVMESSRDEALACVDASVSIGSDNFLAILVGAAGGAGTAIAYTINSVIGKFTGMASAFTFSLFGGGRARRAAEARARNIANKCGDAATRYNKALTDISDNFICGR